jgi:hypothetical protein
VIKEHGDYRDSWMNGIRGIKFWDTSALLPLCLKEPQTETVQGLVHQDGDLVGLVWGAD